MTPQRILTASLDWKLIMTKAEIRFSPQSTNLFNSLVQYLAAVSETEEPSECEAPGCTPGSPFNDEYPNHPVEPEALGRASNEPVQTG